MDHLCDDFESNPVPSGFDIHRIFLWDNPSVHKTAYVTHHISARQTRHLFEVINMPPYIPNIAPISYTICELASELGRRIKRDWTIYFLKWNIRDREWDRHKWKFHLYL